MTDIELQTFKSYENTIPIPKSYNVQVNDKVKFINPNDFDINKLNIQNKNMLVKNRIFYIHKIYKQDGNVLLSSEATPETKIEIPNSLLYDMFSLANNSSTGGRIRRRRRTTRRRTTNRRRRSTRRRR